MATTRTRDSRSSGSSGGQPPAGRRKRKKRNSWVVRVQLFFTYVLVAILVAILAVMLGIGTIIRQMPNSEIDIDNYQPAGRSLIYSSDGTLLASLYAQNRQTVTIDHIPLNLQHATVAIEDSRFYTDKYGVDIRGIGRALFHNLHGGDITGQGGSTITQQLVRNLGIEGIGHEKTFIRKLREIVYAFKVNQNFSKQQILEMYLNQVYYGSGAYGVQAAAGTYFGKPVDKLNLQECALIAGLVQRPSHLSPYVDKDAALDRRNTVLGRMRDLGYIDAATCAKAQASPIILAFPKPPSSGSKIFHAPYFVDYVVKILSDKYGSDLLYRGGLTITTTLNWEMQEAADQAVADGISNGNYLGATDAALVAMEPQTGYIKAMVGGINYEKSQFNIAADGRRQPGSSFKPIIYTAALDSGLITEKTLILDEPITLPGVNGSEWTPKNDDGRYHGWVSAEDAVAQSINIPAVKVLREVGVDTAIHYAAMMGIKSPLAPYLTLALGASAVTPLEMATMYSLIDNQGALPTPLAVEKITTADGTVLEEDQPELETTSIRADALKQMGDMLRAVVTNGTASAVFADDNPPDAHGKTGTTQSHLDVWFDGYTSKLTCVVWAGHPSTDPHTGRPIYGLPMFGDAFGATVCAPIWKQFMVAANGIMAKEAARKAALAAAAKAASQPKPAPAATAASTTAASTDTNSPTPQASSNSTATTPAPAPKTTPANTDLGAQPSADGKTVTVWVDDTSGLRTTPNAPGSHQEAFISGTQPTTYVDGSTVNSASPPPPSSNSTTQPSTNTTTTAPAATTTTTTAAPAPPAVAAAPKMVTVTICIESGMRATEWCPETIEKQFPANQIPKYCTLHKPPPGE